MIWDGHTERDTQADKELVDLDQQHLDRSLEGEHTECSGQGMGGSEHQGDNPRLPQVDVEVVVVDLGLVWNSCLSSSCVRDGRRFVDRRYR